MSDTKPGRYKLRLTKARMQRMEAHATYQPQTRVTLEERQPLSQSASIRALAEQRELAALSSKAVVRVSATGEGVHIIFNEDDAPKPRPRPRRADPGTRSLREMSTIRSMSSIPSILVTDATPNVTPQNSMSGSMLARREGMASVAGALPKQAYLTPRKYNPTFRRKTPNAPRKKVPGRQTPPPLSRARSPSPPIVRGPLTRSPSVSPFITSSTNTARKSLFPKLEEQAQRRKAARRTIIHTQSTEAVIKESQHREAVLEQVAIRRIFRRNTRSPSVEPEEAGRREWSETPEEKHKRRMLAGGTPGPDFSPDPAWSTRPHYEELVQYLPQNADAAGPSRHGRVRLAPPTPGQVRVGFMDPTASIPLALRRVLNAPRASGAQGPAWATDDGQVLLRADGSPEQPQPGEVRRLWAPALGPNGTEIFDENGKRVFVEKKMVQRGLHWYFPRSVGLPVVEEE